MQRWRTLKHGDYDNIAAFIELNAHPELADFLRLFEREKVFVRWEAGNVSYLLWSSRTYIDQFVKNFLPQIRERYQDMPPTEVLDRCTKLAPFG